MTNPTTIPIPQQENAEWRDIPGYEGVYQASNDGQIRRGGGKVIKPRLKNSGYLFVSLQRKNFYVHRLIALVFIGERPNKLDINHINGNKFDNRAANLEYVSRSDNMRHARELGLHNNRADGHYNAKLTSELVKDIRWAYNTAGTGETEIALTLGVSKRTIQDVLENKTWRDANE